MTPVPGPKAFGVNLSGGEYRPELYPDGSSMDYYASKGLRLFRVQFTWERLQPKLEGRLDPTELRLLHRVADDAAARHCKVILDPHNYARYNRSVIGSSVVPFAAFRDFWRRLAREFVGNSGIWAYGLMNEPHDTGGLWTKPGGGAQAGIDGIREVDRSTLILVPGDDWADWHSSENNRVFSVVDPSHTFLYESHIYFDREGSGRYRTGYNEGETYPGIGVERTRPFVDWLRVRGSRGFMGEYGVPDNDPRWLPVLNNFLAYVRDSPELAGGTYWLGGKAGPEDPQRLGVEPLDDGRDRPQMKVLQQYPTDLFGSSAP